MIEDKGLFHHLPKILSSFLNRNDAELLATIDFLRLENQVLRARLPKRLVFTPVERSLLTKAALACGSFMKKAVTIVKPETILHWNAQLKRRKWTFPAGAIDGVTDSSTKSSDRKAARVFRDKMILQFAAENRWGYQRIGGELLTLGLTTSKTHIKNVLRQHGFPIEGKRRDMTWRDFINSHLQTIVACDFFTEEVWTMRGLVRYYTLFFINLFSREVAIAGSTTQPSGAWIAQQARNFCMGCADMPKRPRFLIHDRDGNFSPHFDAIIETEGIEIIRLPAQSPNLNAFAERWVRSLRAECLDHMIFLGADHLRHVLKIYERYYNESRPHQGIGNGIPRQRWNKTGAVRASPSSPYLHLQRNESLPGLLASYHWKDELENRAA